MKIRNLCFFCVCWIFAPCVVQAADAPPSPVEKPGWKLTFQDEFDRPILNDMYWNSAYRSGRKEYFKRIGKASRWVDHNAYYLIENGILTLRIDEKLPFRPNKSTPCVSCITTSDHRFGATKKEYQILDKFAQKHGWFEIRCRSPRGEGLLSAFWLHQHDPTKQEYTPEGVRKKVGDGVVEIDIFEQQGRLIGDTKGKTDLNIHFTRKGHSRPEVDGDLSKEFHIWALKWQEGQVDWYFDGKVVKTYKGPTPQEKMFILVALFQYNGWKDWMGDIDPNMQYPRDLEVDYVRAYKRDKD